MGVPRLMASRGASPKFTKQANAEVAAHGSQSISGSLSEVEGFDRTLDRARASHNYGDRPEVVITAVDDMIRTARADEAGTRGK